MQIVEKILKIPKTKDASISSVGGEIVITDSYKHKLKDVEIGGNTFQQTYTGKNLYNVFDENYASNSSVDEEGWITASYDNTNGTDDAYGNYYTNNLNIATSTQYALMVEIKSVSGDIRTEFASTGSTSQNITNTYTAMSGLTVGIKKYLITTKDSFENVTNGLRTVISFKAGVNSSITFRISVLADTSVTTDNFVYEPYVGGTSSPSPDFPQQVQNVSGSVDVKVANGTDSTAEGYEEQTATLTLPNGMELCKIGNYQDSIIKQNGTWYKNSKIGKIALNGTQGTYYSKNNRTNTTRFQISNAITDMKLDLGEQLISNYFIASSRIYGQDIIGIWNTNSFILYMSLPNSIATEVGNTTTAGTFKYWLAQAQPVIYYVLATPTLEEITDTTLLSQLDNLKNLTTYNGTTIISIDANLTPTISIDYYKNRPVHKYITNKAYYDYMQDIVY